MIYLLMFKQKSKGLTQNNPNHNNNNSNKTIIETHSEVISYV